MPRYIDADAIHYVEIGKGVEIALASDIDKIPTISPDDVLGVGKWISNHDGSWNCSECGLRVLIYAKGNYCPSCGARMKGAETSE